MTVGGDLDAELALALELADIADVITLPPFAAREVTYEWKPDHTEVTALDRAAEAAIVDPPRRRPPAPPDPGRRAWRVG